MAWNTLLKKGDLLPFYTLFLF